MATDPPRGPRRSLSIFVMKKEDRGNGEDTEAPTRCQIHDAAQH
jgi:hypothetical protein